MACSKDCDGDPNPTSDPSQLLRAATTKDKSSAARTKALSVDGVNKASKETSDCRMTSWWFVMRCFLEGRAEDWCRVTGVASKGKLSRCMDSGLGVDCAKAWIRSAFSLKVSLAKLGSSCSKCKATSPSPAFSSWSCDSKSDWQGSTPLRSVSSRAESELKCVDRSPAGSTVVPFENRTLATGCKKIKKCKLNKIKLYPLLCG